MFPLLTITSLLPWIECASIEMNESTDPQASHAASNAEVAVNGSVLAEPNPPGNNRFAFVRETVKRYLEVPEPLASTSDIECAMDDVVAMPYKTDASPLTKNALETFDKNKTLPQNIRKKLNRRLFEKLAQSKPSGESQRNRQSAGGGSVAGATTHSTKSSDAGATVARNGNKTKDTTDTKPPAVDRSRYRQGRPQSYEESLAAAKLRPSFFSIHDTKGEAEQKLGPTFMKRSTTPFFTRWYCKCCDGTARVTKLTQFEHTGPSIGSSKTKYLLERTIKCTHAATSWMDFLLKNTPSDATRGRGLPPQVKQKCDEIQDQYMGISPAMCFQLVHQDLVDKDECFRNPKARMILRTKIMRYRTLSKRRGDRGHEIKTSQDVLLYREKLDLLSKLPSWWTAKPILSETHLYELGKRLSLEGIIGLKPPEAPDDANVPSHLFTLEVPVEEAIKYPEEHRAISQLQQHRHKKKWILFHKTVSSSVLWRCYELFVMLRVRI